MTDWLPIAFVHAAARQSSPSTQPNIRVAGQHVRRLGHARLAAKPLLQFVPFGDGITAFASNRHPGWPSVVLSRGSDGEKFRDRGPALQQLRRFGFRFRFGHRFGSVTR